MIDNPLPKFKVDLHESFRVGILGSLLMLAPGTIKFLRLDPANQSRIYGIYMPITGEYVETSIHDDIYKLALQTNKGLTQGLTNGQHIPFLFTNEIIELTAHTKLAYKILECARDYQPFKDDLQALEETEYRVFSLLWPNKWMVRSTMVLKKKKEAWQFDGYY